jgi:hypothetical protein
VRYVSCCIIYSMLLRLLRLSNAVRLNALEQTSHYFSKDFTVYSAFLAGPASTSVLVVLRWITGHAAVSG